MKHQITPLISILLGNGSRYIMCWKHADQRVIGQFNDSNETCSINIKANSLHEAYRVLLGIYNPNGGPQALGFRDELQKHYPLAASLALASVNND